MGFGDEPMGWAPESGVEQCLCPSEQRLWGSPQLTAQLWIQQHSQGQASEVEACGLISDPALQVRRDFSSAL
jgi:hypothetical protein